MGTEPVSLPTVEVRTAAPQVLRGFQNTHAGAQDLHRIAPNPTAQEVAALSPDPRPRSRNPHPGLPCPWWWQQWGRDGCRPQGSQDSGRTSLCRLFVVLIWFLGADEKWHGNACLRAGGTTLPEFTPAPPPSCAQARSHTLPTQVRTDSCCLKCNAPKFQVYVYVHPRPTLCYPMECSLPGSSVHGDSPGKNTGVGCHALLQWVFLTQEFNPSLLHCRQILYLLSHMWKASPSTYKGKRYMCVCIYIHTYIYGKN